jgi:GNAT superfamily N-acetyltransferase
MPTFTVSTAGPGDLSDVARLFRDYAAALPVDLNAQGFVEELAALPGAYAPPRGVLLLARAGDGAALGCVALRPLDKATGEVKRLYVSPTARGKGVGRALVGALIETARRRGYRELKLDTLDHMQAAIALYRSFGFAPIPAYGSHPYAGLVCLGKTLDAA